MKVYKVVLLVVLISLGVRALVDYYETLHATRQKVNGAAKGTIDCNNIYTTVRFSDGTLFSEIKKICDQRENMGQRWVLFESLKEWLSNLWVCDNLHCSEYIFPVIDQIGLAFRYSIFVTIAVLLMSIWYGVPAILGIILDRLRPQQRIFHGNHCQIDMMGQSPQFPPYPAAHQISYK